MAAGSNLRPAPFLLLARRPPTRQVLLGAACGLALFFAAGGIMSLTTLLVPRAWVDAFDVTRLFEGSRRHQVGMALVASVLAPIAEEIAFRGYVLSALRTHLPPGAAIVGSSVLFASIHLDPVRFPAVLFLGVFLGWLAWRSGSIWPAVAAHGVNNALGSALAARRRHRPGRERDRSGRASPCWPPGSRRWRPWRSRGSAPPPCPPTPRRTSSAPTPATPRSASGSRSSRPGGAPWQALGLLLYAALGAYRALSG